MTGFIFDFNGTLFADADKQEIAWRQFAQNYAKKELSDQEFDDHVHGQNAELTLNYLFERVLSQKEIDEFSEQKEVIYRELCVSDAKNFHLLRGAPAFLDELQARHVPMTIATASAQKNVEFVFDAFNLTKWFNIEDVVFDDGTMKSKPDPDPFLKAAAKLHLPSSNTIIFEDSPSGFAAAEAAGAKRIVGIVTGNRSTLEADSRLDLILDDYQKLSGRMIDQLLY